MPRCLAVLLFVLLLSGPALAGSVDRDLPKPDPEDVWRVITDDPATTTSTCIGKTVSPLCALETKIAAFLRADCKLRAIATGSKRYAKGCGLTRDRTDLVKYRIVSSGRVGKNPPRYDDRHDEMHWAEGDIWMVVDERECSKGHCTTPDPSVAQFLLWRYSCHKIKNSWIVNYTGNLHWEQ